MESSGDILLKARKIYQSVKSGCQVEVAIKWFDLALDQICVLESDYVLDQIFILRERLLDKWSY